MGTGGITVNECYVITGRIEACHGQPRILRRPPFIETNGHRFSSQTDSEVILHLYEEEGYELVHHLIGMFAFALWDERKQVLILARDHVGVKPLLYYWDGRRCLFASELHSLILDPTIPRQIDKTGLELYLALNYIPAPYTIFQACRKLEPAQMVIVRDGQLVSRKYWDPMSGPKWHGREEECIELLRTLLTQAISRQMIADVPLGAFLSGGIDSSIICALMAQNSPHPIKTFTIGYPDMPLYDERAYARTIAQRYETEHHEVLLTAQHMTSAVPEVLTHLDEPFADSSAIPMYVIARETRGEVTVALSGDGGDELFAGYRVYRGEAWYQRYRRLPAVIRHRLIEPVITGLPENRNTRWGDYVRQAKKFLRGQGATLWERFVGWNEVFPPSVRSSLLQGHQTLSPVPTETIFRPLLEKEAGDPINRLLYADFTVSLPGDMLWKVDRMSMAHSLEVRVPLLDHLLCEFMFSLPGQIKLHRGRAKYIFITAFRDLLPEEIQKRPKWGFEIPISRWLGTSMKYLIDQYLSLANVTRQGVFHPPTVDRMVRDFLSGKSDTAWHIWNLIVFQAWYERYLGT
ncbi:MAG: asparagine synthase (glutamine-hydrolyzing) [Candidatus Methanosuratus sp.]|nr:asparagine synthase (glutamine-hydrolyzing) [Candidatus Methanosuratincola sp.]